MATNCMNAGSCWCACKDCKYPDDWKQGGPGVSAGMVISDRVFLVVLVISFVGMLWGWW